ncbi:aminodeoxychorismate lyase [Bacillus salitolerans]|uniref:Aminodeoxychorismate lyase n=1 Tax=Bacillus salitolerans TaxID=1437434 RepID=A0ABW4LP30_9BACI
MYIHLNGQIVEEKEASLSVFDHGFMYGLGLFETFRVYQGHPFLLHDHLDRLRSGLNELNIRWEFSNQQILSFVQKLLEVNGLEDAYVRLNVSAGVGGIGLMTDVYEEPTTIIYIKPIPSMLDSKKGVILNIPRNTPEGSYRLKSHHYLNNILAKRELGPDPSLEGVFLTADGKVAEGIVSNIFWVCDNILYTPSVDTGILNGITRQFIIKLLKANGVSIVEGKYDLNNLYNSTEVFVTNSIQEIVPISGIGNLLFKGKNGEITQKLQREYNNMKRLLFTMDDYVGRFDIGDD